jgi:hypothetical protein
MILGSIAALLPPSRATASALRPDAGAPNSSSRALALDDRQALRRSGVLARFGGGASAVGPPRAWTGRAVGARTGASRGPCGSARSAVAGGFCRLGRLRRSGSRRLMPMRVLCRLYGAATGRSPRRTPRAPHNSRAVRRRCRLVTPPIGEEEGAGPVGRETCFATVALVRLDCAVSTAFPWQPSGTAARGDAG